MSLISLLEVLENFAESSNFCRQERVSLRVGAAATPRIFLFGQDQRELRQRTIPTS